MGAEAMENMHHSISNNTAIGHEALYKQIQLDNNTAIGFNTLLANTTGT